MKLPKTIKIISTDVDIEYMSKELAEDLGRFGDFDPDKDKVRIQKGMKPTRTLETLWHELTHGIEDQVGVDDSWTVEESIRAICSCQIAMLRDNPKLLEYVNQTLKVP